MGDISNTEDEKLKDIILKHLRASGALQKYKVCIQYYIF